MQTMPSASCTQRNDLPGAVVVGVEVVAAVAATWATQPPARYTEPTLVRVQMGSLLGDVFGAEHPTRVAAREGVPSLV